MLTSYAVTSGKNCRGQIVTEAKQWAGELQVPFVPRLDNMSLETMLTYYEVEGLLIATTQGPRLFTASGTFFFHPGMGMLRWKKLFGGAKQVGAAVVSPTLPAAVLPDHFAAATQLKPGQRYLDCTLGLGADALIALHMVGKQGKAVGLEASLLLHFVVSRGLKAYRTNYLELAADLQRLETYHTQALPFLQRQPADSFDVIYFDPMFRFPVHQSSTMQPLRPLAFEEPLTRVVVQEALRVAPRVVIKERGETILRALGCRSFTGGRYSRIKFGIVAR